MSLYARPSSRDGAIARAVDAATLDHDILYFTSAGNNGHGKCFSNAGFCPVLAYHFFMYRPNIGDLRCTWYVIFCRRAQKFVRSYPGKPPRPLLLTRLCVPLRFQLLRVSPFNFLVQHWECQEFLVPGEPTTSCSTGTSAHVFDTSRNDEFRYELHLANVPIQLPVLDSMDMRHPPGHAASTPYFRIFIRTICCMGSRVCAPCCSHEARAELLLFLF